MTDSGGSMDLDLAVSSLAADAGDTQLMFRLLTERLAEVLGDRMRIERAGGLFRKSNVIRRVEVRLPEQELIAELGGTTPAFSIGRLSGGIRIRTDRTDVTGWLRALLESLQREAEHSAITRQALEAIVIGGN